MLFITLLVPTASMTLKAAYLGFWLLAIIGSSLVGCEELGTTHLPPSTHPPSLPPSGTQAIVVYRRDFVDMPCLVRDEMRF